MEHYLLVARSITHAQQMMKTLEQAANQGNPMAKNMLQKINSGDMSGAQQILGNFMNEQGLNIQEIQKQIQK